MSPAPFGDMYTGTGNIVFVAHLKQILKTADFEGELVEKIVIVKAVFMESNGKLRRPFGTQS